MGTGEDRWRVIPPVIEELKAKARKLGLWNMFLADHREGNGSGEVSNLEYAHLAEIMGRSLLASEATNCAAP